jgi:DNA-binding PadR family transcriptional regulator
MARTRTDDLLLGEWACLTVLAEKPAHGYDVARRLAPSGEVGRVWSLSRALTYRALDQLEQRGLITNVGEERGKAGGTRTVLAPTRRGRAMARRWLTEPVPHLRDVRGELLLKLVLGERAGIDTSALLEAQRGVFAPIVDGLAAGGGRGRTDPVGVWRYESSQAALRFIDRMLRAASTTGPG